MYSCLALLYIAASRFLVRYYFLTRHIQPTEARVAIYGAGEAGARLSTVLSATRAFDPLVFIDDNRSLHGRMVNGIKVYPPDELPALIKARNLDRVLLALLHRLLNRVLKAVHPHDQSGDVVVTVTEATSYLRGPSVLVARGELSEEWWQNALR